MARRTPTPNDAGATNRGPAATGPANTAERLIESTGSTVRVLLEPLPDKQVRILEYHRRRKGETRYQRQKDEEGFVVDYDQLKLEQGFDEFFPQGSLFDAAD